MSTSKTSQRSINDALRTAYLEKIMQFLANDGEDVLRISSGEICIPVVDSQGDDKFVQFCVKVPTGSRDDSEGFDGYGMAQQYSEKCAEVEAKRKKKEAEAEARAKKIAERKASKSKGE